MARSRVVITGIGVVSPIGLTRETFWTSCLEGRSGVSLLDTPWVQETGLSTQIAAQVKNFDPEAAGVPSRLTGLIDRTAEFAIAATQEALTDAGYGLVANPEKKNQLKVEGVDSSRLATVIGSAIGGLTSLEISHGVWRENRSKSKVKRYALPMLIPNAPAGQVAIRFGATAECKAVSTACAAGTMSIGDSWRLLTSGGADVVLAGGAEGVARDADAYGLMGFDRLRTLSTRNHDPEGASRPFEKNRDGFVLGEGAAVFVLEREEDARARGARTYAAIVGYSTNCDAHSMMQLDESGRSVVELIREGLEVADLAPTDVEHISAHGTATILNDRTEAKALRLMFDSHCDRIAVTGLKSMTGHAIGASGPLEAAALALSLQRGILTPTINYETPDPECDVNIVANRPIEARPKLALKLSYGFGGHNACLVMTP